MLDLFLIRRLKKVFPRFLNNCVSVFYLSIYSYPFC